MPYVKYQDNEPLRVEIDREHGPLLLEFGSGTCPHCRAAEPLIAEALAGLDSLRYIKIQDGSGRPLGRSFKVTLWPTLIFLKDGKEVTRVVRPASVAAIGDALQQIVARSA
jgi:thioredoxin 1